MKINTENYQAYFLDFFEGNLSEADTAMLFDFLESHPALKEEFDSFEMMPLDEQPVIFPDKESLKKESLPVSLGKEINTDNCETYFIAWHEGDLNDEEKVSVQEFLKAHPEKQHDFELFAKTKIQEEAIVFSSKESLKRQFQYTKTISSELPELSIETSDMWFAASLEGDLNTNQEKELQAFLMQYPEFIRQRALFEKTILKPDMSVVFPSKSSLKVYPALTSFKTPQWVRIAAAVLLMAGAGSAYFFLRPETNKIVADRNAVHISKPDTEPAFSNQSKPETKTGDNESTKPSKSPKNNASQTIVEENKVLPLFASNTIKPMPTINNLIIEVGDVIDPGTDDRSEFDYPTAYLKLPSLDEDMPEEQIEPKEYQSLTQLAYNKLKSRNPIDMEQVQDRLDRNRFTIWDLAGAGLTGFGYLTGRSMAVDKQRDESGRITGISIGKYFEISKK